MELYPPLLLSNPVSTTSSCRSRVVTAGDDDIDAADDDDADAKDDENVVLSAVVTLFLPPL